MSDLGRYEDWKSLEYAIAHIDEARAAADELQRIKNERLKRELEMCRNMTREEQAIYAYNSRGYRPVAPIFDWLF